MAVNMLYQCIVGPESFKHPEIQAFILGFQLPCVNGFSFIKVCILHRCDVATANTLLGYQVT